VLIGLFNAGLATASVEAVSAGQRMIEVTRLQITGSLTADLKMLLETYGCSCAA
jgi:hypothetical protein